jgi:hypothetical protein
MVSQTGIPSPFDKRADEYAPRSIKPTWPRESSPVRYIVRKLDAIRTFIHARQKTKSQ